MTTCGGTVLHLEVALQVLLLLPGRGQTLKELIGKRKMEISRTVRGGC